MLLKVSAVAAFVLCAIAAEEATTEFKSGNPLYAKINLSADGSKHLVVALDESGGTGKGYDVMRVSPGGFQGTVARVGGTVQRYGSGETAGQSVAFRPVQLASYVQQAQIKEALPGSLTISCSQSKRQQNVVSLRASWQTEKMEGRERWVSTVNKAITAHPSVEAAEGVSLESKPAIKLTARQAKSEKGALVKAVELGIAVQGEGSGSAARIYMMKNNKQLDVAVTVKNQDGDVVKSEKGTADKFSFG